MCFGIRISSPFHLATLILPIANHKCPKNAKNACADVLIGLFSSKDITIASLLQVTSISIYNSVRPLQQRQGTPPVQEVKWKLIDLKFSSPEEWLISCKVGHLLIKAQLQLEHGLGAGGEEARLEDSPDTKWDGYLAADHLIWMFWAVKLRLHSAK